MRILLQTSVCYLLLTLITGILYPMAVTGISFIFFPHQSKGSLVMKNGMPVGSALLAQPFKDSRYFWGRPSASDYSTVPSGSSNLGPVSKKLKETVAERERFWRSSHGLAQNSPVPVELLTASASGLDPHITLKAAEMQISRVASSRGMSEDSVRDAVISYIEPGPLGGILGENSVNVFLLNFYLDQIQSRS
jgi:potassium-transporting ATPase KdpC subunit